MNNEKRTTMSLAVATKEALRKFKVHHRETDEDIIKRIILDKEIEQKKEAQHNEA